MSELPNVPGGDAPDLGGITGGSDDHDVGKTASSAPKPQSSSPDQKDPNAGPVESTISPAAKKVGGDTGAEIGKEGGKVAGEAIGGAAATAALGPEAAPIGAEMGGQIGSTLGENAGRNGGKKVGHEVAHTAASPVDDQISGKSSDNKPGGPKPGKGKLDNLDNQFEGAQSGLSSHANPQESMTFSPMASGDANKSFALTPEPPSPTHPKDKEDSTRKLR